MISDTETTPEPSRFHALVAATQFAGIAVIYFIAAKLSLLLAVGNTNVTSVWPPSGIALAVVLIGGYRFGPAVFLGALCANLLSLQGIGLAPGQYITASTVTAFGNMFEAVAGAYLIRRFTGSGNPFENIRDLFFFIVMGCFAGTAISATLGVFSYCTAIGNWTPVASLWITWWLGDASGILIATPVIVMFKNRMRVRLGGSALVEAIIVFPLLIAATGLIFWKNYHFEYLIIPILIWIAVRFGRFEVSAAVFSVSAVTIVATINGAGPLSDLALSESLLFLQSYVGVISIITLSLSVLTFENRQSERMRSDVQKQLYDIIDFLPDATFAIDRNGVVIAWNKAIEALSGVSKTEMIGKGDYAYAVPFFGERRPILIDLVMKPAGPELSATYDYINQQHSTIFAERYNPILDRHLSGAASVLIDKDGTMVGAIESIRDISDRKIAELALMHYKENLEAVVELRSSSLMEANKQLTREMEERDRIEKALVESERKYRDLVESANSVILRWKPDGSITFFNTYAQKFFGYTEPEILGKSVVGTIVPAVETSGRDLALLMEELANNPEAHAFNENENMRKNGERVWIAWTNKPIFGESGSIMEILSVGNDITGRKIMEESLKKTLGELAVEKDRAEAADRTKSAFLATMSHELRTPLNSIIGFTGIILQGLAGPLNEEQTKQLGMVRGSAQHLLSLINDVLDISKIEAGQLEVYAEPFDARGVVESSFAAMKPAADKKRLSFKMNIASDVGEAIGDRRRVEQVLLNLISNAIKFTEQGMVEVSASVLADYRPAGTDSGAFVSGPVLSFRVSDAGIGIRREDVADLFQPFRQIDTGLTRKNEGTGLGLAICRRLAGLMGGGVFVESEWGKGSTFTFILPLRSVENDGQENTSH